MSRTVYRRATPQDLAGIVRLGEEMHEETAFSNIPFSIDRTVSETMRCIMEPSNFCGVAERDGKIVGILFGYLDKPFFSDELIGYDIVWYVDRATRNSMVGPRLLKGFEAWVKAFGGVAVLTTLGSNVKPERVGKLMERMGFEYQGGFYRKDI